MASGSLKTLTPSRRRAVAETNTRVSTTPGIIRASAPGRSFAGGLEDHQGEQAGRPIEHNPLRCRAGHDSLVGWATQGLSVVVI
jgi:hypothetical protein